MNHPLRGICYAALFATLMWAGIIGAVIVMWRGGGWVGKQDCSGPTASQKAREGAHPTHDMGGANQRACRGL